MTKTIYEKSTRALIKDMIVGLGLQPGQVFTVNRALEWFEANYPKLKASSIRAHLVQSSTNDANRLHHRLTNSGDDLFFKVAPGQYRLYVAGSDPAPIREYEPDAEDAVLPDDVEEAPSDNTPVSATEFMLERDLQLYLVANLGCIEPGLKLYEDDGVDGLEYEVGNGRRLDILAVDAKGNLVVLELKVSKGYDRVIGQLLRYVNWIRQNLAQPGQSVRGIIVCRRISEDLRLACANISDVELFEYKLSVTVSKVDALTL